MTDGFSGGLLGTKSQLENVLTDAPERDVHERSTLSTGGLRETRDILFKAWVLNQAPLETC